MNKEIQSHICLVLFGVLTAISSLFIHQTEKLIDPVLVAFYSFLICGIFYSLLSRGSFLKKITKEDFLEQDKKTMIKLNIATALCWLCGLFSLKFISAFAYLSLYLGLMPVIILFFKNIESLAALLVSILFLAGLFYTEQKFSYFGMTLAMIGGVSGVMYSLYSKKLQGRLSSMEILSGRFILLLGVSFLWVVSKNEFHWLPVNFYNHFLGIAFMSIVFPLYFFQQGIQHLPPAIALRYMPLAPLICAVFSLMSGGLS